MCIYITWCPWIFLFVLRKRYYRGQSNIIARNITCTNLGLVRSHFNEPFTIERHTIHSKDYVPMVFDTNISMKGRNKHLMLVAWVLIIALLLQSLTACVNWHFLFVFA